MAITKRFLFLLLIATVAACSPRINKQVNPPVKPGTTEKPTVTEEKAVPKFTVANVSVLLPFKLDKVNLNTATKAQLAETDMAIDFYQGLTMGIDSAASFGLNFNLHVFDSRDDNARLLMLTKNEQFKKSQLIIGPVFPEGIKYLSNLVISRDIPLVSPLAATRPSDFNNPKLISIIGHIDQHSEKIAAYIGNKYSVERGIVALINSKKAEEEEFAQPIRAYLNKKYPNLIIQEFASASVFETRMIRGKKYAVVICSSDPAFVNPTVDKLARLAKLRANDYEFQLFGHPAWLKQSYNIEQLQVLHTIISTSYYINYKDTGIISFIKKYRAKYSFEPSEYAFKGFDIGFYFGKLLARHGKEYADFLLKDKYKGLHNTFSFGYDPLYGYYNKDLMLLQYKNLSLIPVN
ncbi:hypothetical protein D9M68_563380 [compost metagenome]